MLRRVSTSALIAVAAASPAAAQDPSDPVPEPVPEPDRASPSPSADPDPAADPEPDPDLAEIEAALASDAAAAAESAPTSSTSSTLSTLGALMNPDISFILDVAAAWFLGGDETGENFQRGAHDPTRNGFNLQQLEMSIGKSVDPYFRFDGNIVFAQFGVEVEEAYATTLALPHSLQVRAGQFLTRFGRINPTHPHAWDFVDQPFAMSRVFGGEGNRGLGAELSWLTPLPWFVEVIASVTDPVGEATARSFFGPVDLPLETPLDLQTTAAIKQFFELSDDWSLLAGASLATGPNPTGHDNRTDVWGIDLYLKWRPITEASDQIVSLQTEWLYRRRQIPGDVLADLSGYAQVLWRFARRWGTAARYELGTAADDAGADYLDPDWTGARQRATANVTFWPSEFSRLRAQASVDVPDWSTDGADAPTIWAVFLAFEVSVGAHGAHTF